uniref:Uncharacterized protein n=1 Tax=Vespula pensylvanica TaxID=30213 RepID=A0A834N4T0_VESPE|nr:hypothetical protein H0235_016933 [Vespula pensylvanica]
MVTIETQTSISCYGKEIPKRSSDRSAHVIVLHLSSEKVTRKTLLGLCKPYDIVDHICPPTLFRSQGTQLFLEEFCENVNRTNRISQAQLCHILEECAGCVDCAAPTLNYAIAIWQRDKLSIHAIHVTRRGGSGAIADSSGVGGVGGEGRGETGESAFGGLVSPSAQILFYRAIEFLSKKRQRAAIPKRSTSKRSKPMDGQRQRVKSSPTGCLFREKINWNGQWPVDDPRRR